MSIDSPSLPTRLLVVGQGLALPKRVLDDVRLSARALSAEEVRALYETGK